MDILAIPRRKPFVMYVNNAYFSNLHTWKQIMDAVVIESVLRQATYLTECIDRGKSVVASTAISASVRGRCFYLWRLISRPCSGLGGGFTWLEWSQISRRHRWYRFRRSFRRGRGKRNVFRTYERAYRSTYVNGAEIFAFTH